MKEQKKKKKCPSMARSSSILFDLSNDVGSTGKINNRALLSRYAWLSIRSSTLAVAVGQYIDFISSRAVVNNRQKETDIVQNKKITYSAKKKYESTES